MALPGEMGPAAHKLADQFADMTAAAFVDACREFIREFNTLPKPLPHLRRQALKAMRAEAVNDDRLIRHAADRAGLARNRFYRLTARTEAAA